MNVYHITTLEVSFIIITTIYCVIVVVLVEDISGVNVYVKRVDRYTYMTLFSRFWKWYQWNCFGCNGRCCAGCNQLSIGTSR